MVLPSYSIHHGDCLDVLRNSELQNCVDAVIADPPYGTTKCKWDSIIPLEAMWNELYRVLKPAGVIVLTASQPYSSALVMSNPQDFRHEWVWIKNRGSNFANTMREPMKEPMKEHEVVLVFSPGKWTYNRQMQERSASGLERTKYTVEHNDQDREGTRKFEGREHHKIDRLRVPSSWQKFNVASGKEKTTHPTQKPVALMEYLVKTYTNTGDIVLDFAMGSGTTGVACMLHDRNFIGIDTELEYVELARDRIDEAARITASRPIRMF